MPQDRARPASAQPDQTSQLRAAMVRRNIALSRAQLLKLRQGSSIVTDPRPRRVLVLQGGGALGSYQAGVYEGFHGAGLEPDWVAGISIGAVNAALIAGNPPQLRLQRLREFWDLVTSQWPMGPTVHTDQFRSLMGDASIGWAVAAGVPGFFSPRIVPPAFATGGGPEALSFYDSGPLKTTLERLVDFDRINARETRLSVGAVNIRTGNFAYFDNAHTTIRPEHIMASGALPPGLPPVEIDGEWYWDGGLVSNTPLEYVLDADRTDDLTIYQVDLFNARGPMPRTIQEAAEREKDIRYSSRTRLNTDAQLRIHRLKTALSGLLKTLPAGDRDIPDLDLLEAFSKESTITVVQLIYRDRAYEGAYKDVEFSRQTMLDHWASGVTDAERAIRRRRTNPPHPKPGGAVAVDPGLDGSDKSSPAPPISASKDAAP
jgi:NTE family protein